MLAAAVAGLGLLNLWSALLAEGPHRGALLQNVVHMPMVLVHGSRTLIAVFGLCLMMLSRSLLRRKKQAWLITVMLITPSPFLHLAKGLDWEEAMICIVLLAGLLFYRRSFYAENDKPSAKQGLKAALAFFTFAVIYGPLGFFLLRNQFEPRATLRLAILESTHLTLAAPENSQLDPRTRRADWFEDTLQLISALAISYGVFMLLRPVLPQGVIEEREHAEARRLLTTWGGPPLAYFGLLPDKRYLFGPSATGPNLVDPPPAGTLWAVPYRVVGGCAIALGDPIGDPLKVDEAISGFIKLCGYYDWLPAFYQVTARHLHVFRDAGLKVFKIGEDAVIDLTSFTLKGKAFQDLRTAINKMTRVGIVFEEFDTKGSEEDDILTQLAEITEDWLDAHHGEEKGFAMGQYAPGTDLFEDSRLFFARDTETDSVLAFVTFVPIFGGKHAPHPSAHATGWALDLMRRRTSAPNGVMDFLIASAASEFKAEGAEVMSLGLSPLADTEEDECLEGTAADPNAIGGSPRGTEGDEWLDRMRAILFERFNQFYHFKGLNSFKSKFAPGWEPRYMVFPKATHLPTVAYAVVRAHASRRLRYLIGFKRKSTLPSPAALNADTAGSVR